MNELEKDSLMYSLVFHRKAEFKYTILPPARLTTCQLNDIIIDSYRQFPSGREISAIRGPMQFMDGTPNSACGHLQVDHPGLPVESTTLLKRLAAGQQGCDVRLCTASPHLVRRRNCAS